MRKLVQKRELIVLLLTVCVAVVACASPAAPTRTASLPPASAGPAEVLDAYLRALVKGDCDFGQTLVATTFVKGNGELCGETQVSVFAVDAHPAHPSSGEVVFSTTLTTTGAADGTIRPGIITWYYVLELQSSGRWLIVGGGSGP